MLLALPNAVRSSGSGSVLHLFPRLRHKRKLACFAFQPINAAARLLLGKAPKPVTISAFLARTKSHKNESHAPLLHEASYFGLMRQPYLVSLWQLDLERAESRGPPLDVERKA